MTVNVIPLCLSIDYFRSESLRSFTVSKQDFSLCLPLICRWQISAFGHSAVFSLLHTCLSNCKQFEESFVLASHRGSPSCRASPLQKQSTGLFLNSPLSSASGVFSRSSAPNETLSRALVGALPQHPTSAPERRWTRPGHLGRVYRFRRITLPTHSFPRFTQCHKMESPNIINRPPLRGGRQLLNSLHAPGRGGGISRAASTAPGYLISSLLVSGFVSASFGSVSSSMPFLYSAEILSVSMPVRSKLR